MTCAVGHSVGVSRNGEGWDEAYKAARAAAMDEVVALKDVLPATIKSLGTPDPDVVKHKAPLPGREKAAGGKEAYYQGVKRREAWLEAYARNFDMEEAHQAAGITGAAYRKWRRTYPEFAGKVDALRANDAAELKTGFKAGFAKFRKRYLKMDSTWFHLLMVDAFENGAPGSVTMVLLPPEHGKTTLVEDFITYKLATDPDFRITVGSASTTHARKVLRRVRNRLEPGFNGPFPEMVARFGPFAPVNGDGKKTSQPWTDDRFDVYKRSAKGDERDYSMVAVGVNSNVQGTRCDLLILDDVQSLKTAGQSEQIVETIRQDFLSRPGALGRTVIVGTRVADDDVYERLQEAGVVDRLISFPAINGDGEYLWPERYTPEHYARMERNAGPDAWLRNYQQSPRRAGTRHFTEDEILAAGNPLRAVWHEPDLPHLGIGIAQDPGFGTNALVWGAFYQDRMVVLGGRVDHNLRSTEQMAQLIEEQCHVYWPQRSLRGDMYGAHGVTDLIIEDKAFQKGLLNDKSYLAVQQRFGFRISGHTTGADKYDPNLGVPSMARFFRTGAIELPMADDPATREFFGLLLDQLTHWRPVKGTRLTQDLVMALWFLYMRWLEVSAAADAFKDGQKVAVGGRGLGRRPTPVRLRGRVL